MSLQLRSVSFETDASIAHVAQTDSGNALSVLFDNLVVRSGAADKDAQPQALRLDGEVQCTGRGWVTIQVRGQGLSTDRHGYAHLSAWANGRRLHAAAAGLDEPFSASVAVPVDAERIQLSLLLLAQRDLNAANSAAECAVDSIDLLVIAPSARRSA
ncbi:hypothetical protein [Roseateles sp. BYS96W]|uniref:Uncharacterized protein n=1 Tax=Pelomonas nitida TaxID=3299027 RepID=A0ABW7G524_9BURK